MRDWLTGDCFHDAVQYALALEEDDPDAARGMKIVHGHVKRPSGLTPIRHHAWVESGSVVIDPTIDLADSKAKLRAAGLVYVAEQRYSPDRALRLSVRHGHWGPFTAAERKAVR